MPMFNAESQYALGHGHINFVQPGYYKRSDPGSGAYCYDCMIKLHKVARQGEFNLRVAWLSANGRFEVLHTIYPETICRGCNRPLLDARGNFQRGYLAPISIFPCLFPPEWRSVEAEWKWELAIGDAHTSNVKLDEALNIVKARLVDHRVVSVSVYDVPRAFRTLEVQLVPTFLSLTSVFEAQYQRLETQERTLRREMVDYKESGIRNL